MFFFWDEPGSLTRVYLASGRLLDRVADKDCGLNACSKRDCLFRVNDRSHGLLKEFGESSLNEGYA